MADFQLAPRDLAIIQAACKDGKKRTGSLILFEEAKEAISSSTVLDFWEKILSIINLDQDEEDFENAVVFL